MGSSLRTTVPGKSHGATIIDEQVERPRGLMAIAKNLASMENAPNDEEWNILMGAYKRGELTPAFQDELNFAMNDVYYYRKFVMNALDSVIGFERQQAESRAQAEAESLRQKMAERVKPPKNCIGLCSSHFAGWQRDNQGFESSYFKVITRGSILCGLCESPTAIVVIKIK